MPDIAAAMIVVIRARHMAKSDRTDDSSDHAFSNSLRFKFFHWLGSVTRGPCQ
jgi:hypothetical protein